MSNGPKTQVAQLPSEKTFMFSYTSEIEGGKVYSGPFTVVRPTIMMQIRIESEKSRLLGGTYHDPTNPGQGVPDYVMQMADSLSFLRVCVTQSPEWWGGGEGIHDLELLVALYEEAQKIDPFRAQVQSEAGDDGSAGESSHQGGDGTNVDGRIEAMVD